MADGYIAPVARIFSFPPIETPAARVLILGSIPGVRSLEAGQYYAHPQNAFWRIVGEFCGFDPALPYGERVQHLCRHGIAVWDVLQACEREGSLDTAIRAGSECANDLAAFFASHLALRGVLCNGGKAFSALQCSAKSAFARFSNRVEVMRLPSTSPANAGMPRDSKAQIWHAALRRWLASV